MEKRFQFPAVLVKKAVGGFEGICGLDLKSMLKADLFFNSAGSKEEGKENSAETQVKNLHLMREAFVRGLYVPTSEFCLEMRLTALPDLFQVSNGKVFISLIIRTLSPSEEGAREQAVSKYLGVRPLVLACMKEAEFVPILTEELLERRLNPFPVNKALSIGRFRETLSLATPFQRLNMGFGAEGFSGNGKSDKVSHLFPWAPSFSDWRNFLDTLMGQIDPCQVIVRLKPALDNQNFRSLLDSTIRTCELFMAGMEERQIPLMRQAGAIRDVAVAHLSELRHCSFHVGVFLLSPRPLELSQANVLGGSITAMSGKEDGTGFYQGGFSIKPVSVPEASAPDFFGEKELFTTTEAACAFRLPSPLKDESQGLPIRRSRTSAAALPYMRDQGEDNIELVLNEHQGLEQPVIVNQEDRMLHAFIIGATGSGKSTLMENMILQDIRAGRGVAVIDPHGELVEMLMGKIPRDRWQDVILFDLLEKKRPMGFNLLEYRNLDERDLIIDELYLTLDRIWDMRVVGGPIWESNFRGMLKCLMGEQKDHEFVPTLLDFTSCYLEEGFRKWLKRRICDPQTLDFLVELERTQGDAALCNLSPYITSKFSRFIHDTTLKRIVGQEKTAFDFDDIMNNGRIFLVNLGKGRFGSTASALLANQLVSRFKLAAMKRGGRRANERKPFYLYLDEAHNLPSENLCELLSEARKYRLGLILATQYTGQIAQQRSGEGDLLSAILGNVGTILTFRLGLDDAMKLAPILYPSFAAADIVGLSNWHGYCRLQVNGSAPPPFSFRTRKDMTPFDAEAAFKVRALSNMKHGVDARLVDKGIMKRRSFWKNGG